MGRKWLLLLLLFAVFVFLATVLPSADGEEAGRSFLLRCGYETGEGTLEEVMLPEAEDASWKEYLFLQRENGFDMEPYLGRKVLKYTYTVLNYPYDGMVYANIYWADGKIIGGDIMSPALDGFIYGLPFDLL